MSIPVGIVWAEYESDVLHKMDIPVIFRGYSVLNSDSFTCQGPPPSVPPAPPLPSAAGDGQPSTKKSRPLELNEPGPLEPNGDEFRDRLLAEIYAGATTSVDKSERLFALFTVQPALFNTARTPLVHGANISRTGYEERGTCGVFVCPEDSGECHLLTAGHFLDGEPGSMVQQISHLDVMHALTKVFKGEPNLAEQSFFCKRILDKVQPSVATLIEHKIGVSEDGWREDWAVARVASKFMGVNGDFVDEFMLNIKPVLTPDLAERIGAMDVAEGVKGEIVFKVGASTGYTTGILNKTDMFIYERGTAYPTHTSSSQSVDTRLQIIFPHLPKGSKFCLKGDSGAGVFVLRESTTVSWVGMLVGMEHKSGDGTAADSIGLMIPQQVILSHLREATGKTWTLYRGSP